MHRCGLDPETGGLVVEHDVVPVGNAHKIIAACHGQKRGQIFNIVLVCLHVVGVAAVTAHGYTGEFAHKMIFKTGSGHLPGIVEILRANKTNHGID